jgi:hypothetical protein
MTTLASPSAKIRPRLSAIRIVSKNDASPEDGPLGVDCRVVSKAERRDRHVRDARHLPDARVHVAPVPRRRGSCRGLQVGIGDHDLAVLKPSGTRTTRVTPRTGGETINSTLAAAT